MISHPCVHEDLDKVIYEIMGLGNFVFFAPDGIHPIVLEEEVIDNLPEEMVNLIGEPKIAKDFSEFSKLLVEIFP